MPPNASITSTASWSTALSSARSVTHIRLSGACAMHRSTTWASRSPRRAQMPTVAPWAARASANPAPMPEEAPVTSVRHPCRFKAIAPPHSRPLPLPWLSP